MNTIRSSVSITMVARTYTQCNAVGLFSCAAPRPGQRKMNHASTISSAPPRGVNHKKAVKVNPSQRKLTTRDYSRITLKSCVKTNKSPDSVKKNVTFDSIEIREHPRILGDNPSVKRGPALSLGWYNKGRETKLSVNEFEKLRSPKRRKCLVMSSRDRKRILQQEAGVTARQMYAAKMEASKIKRSRQQNNILQDYDEAVVVLEICARTFTRLLNGYVSEWEFQELMARAERAKKTHSK